jgi:death-on-curing protein
MNWEWISISVAKAIHDKQIAEHGGIAGAKNLDLIESALARPRQLAAYGNPPPDAADLAAAYAFGIVRNHGFNDGNKRTAWVLARLFLALNGVKLQFNQADAYVAMMALAASQLDERGFSDWLRQRMIAT